MDDSVDNIAGIVFHKRPGMSVVEGDVLATVYTERGGQLDNAVQRILDSVPSRLIKSSCHL